MAELDLQIDFTESHHALLFGWIAKATIEAIGGQKGEAILRKAVQVYGIQRGRRMALRAKANRHPLNMLNYIAYSEWTSSPGSQHEKQIIDKAPNARYHIYRCPWYTAWKDEDLLPFARYYCLEVDQALARGFNPDLRLDVNGTLSNGAARCEFVFHDANLTASSFVLLAYRKAVLPGKSAVMPWEYHVGHLFTTLEKVLGELGETGRKAAQAGLMEFQQRFGEKAAQCVVDYRSVDFDSLP